MSEVQQLLEKVAELERLLAESQERQRRDERLWMDLIAPPKKSEGSDSGG